MNNFKKLFSLLIMFLCIGASATYAQEHFRRGLEQNSFVPKGQWITGITANYSQSNQDSYQFLIVEGISGDTYSFKVSPMACYIFKDNLGVGGRLAYSRSLTNLSNVKVVIDSETDFNVENLYSLSDNYAVMGIFRNYISLGKSKRFGLFNEVQLEFGTGTSKLTNGKGTDSSGSYERSYSVNVGLAPGIVMFLNNYSAIEVNVGVLGFNYTSTTQTTDRIHVSNRDSKSANFKINLFSISIGVAFYL